MVTAGVLLATECVRIGYPQLDLVAALLVAAFIGWTPSRADLHTIVTDAWRWHSRIRSG